MNKMSNKLDLIKKLDDELGSKSELKETKSLRLLKEIVSLLKNTSTDDNFKLIKEKLDSILNKINFKNYTSNFEDLKLLLEQIKDKDTGIDSLGILINKLIEIISSQEYPDKIEVTNFPKQKEFPKKISIDNFPEQKTKIEVTNFPKQKEFPTEIKVSNFPEPQKRIKVDIDKEIKIKKPIWYKPVILEPLFNKLIDVINNISNKVFNVSIKEHEKPNKAIAVKLVDKEGKFIDELIPPIHISNPRGSGGGNSSSSVVDPIGLKNISGSGINPATEEKQNDIISALGGSSTYIIYIDDYTTSNVTYIGQAQPGTSDSSPSWQIKKLDESGDYPYIKYADGVTTFNKVWNNRVIYSYS